MKKFVIVLSLFLLTGCTVSKSIDIYSDLDNCLRYLNQSFDVRTNHNAEYYSYYVPSDMQDFEGNTNSNVMAFRNAKIVMNLNIASIVNSESFGINYFVDDGFFKKDYKTYEYDDSFVKNNGEISKYQIEVYEKDNYYLVRLVTDELIFYCTCDEYDLIDVVKHIFTIASSIEVEKDKIVTNYSKKDVIEYVKQQVNLFEYDIPSSGFLNELVNQSGGIVHEGDGDIDNTNNVVVDEEKEEEINIEEEEDDSLE